MQSGIGRFALKASGIADVTGFDFMDRPSKNWMLKALEHLYALEALDDDGKLTETEKRWHPFLLILHMPRFFYSQR